MIEFPRWRRWWIALAVATGVSSPGRAQSPNVDLLYQGPDREQRLVQGAKAEGQVVLYSAMIVNQALRPIATAFQYKYPFIKITYWRGNSEEIAVRLSAEMKANRLVADVVEGTGIGELAVQAQFAQPVWSPELVFIPQVRRDPRGLWLPTRMSYFAIAYNTKLVPAEKAPKTYEDLLDPRWKGKMAWPVGSASAAALFITNLRMAWGEKKAAGYLKQLSAQDVINFGSGNARALVDRVIAGEYPIALAIFAHHPLISASKGAPVDSQLLPPVASAAGTLAVPRGVKHPYSAMLLIDFILSTEGQRILTEAEYLPVRPAVEPLPQIASIVPSRAGVVENFISPENLNKYTESSSKIIQDLFR
jgi:ABC-type Fe3+ transport system substrate-binding protein